MHNVLWGGGGTNDSEIFDSLVNIILAKIQDEYEKEAGKNMISRFINMVTMLKARIKSTTV